MFCTNCGSQQKDGAKFCTVCGAPLTQTPPVEGALPVEKGVRSQESGGKGPVIAAVVLVVVALAAVVGVAALMTDGFGFAKPAKEAPVATSPQDPATQTPQNKPKPEETEPAAPAEPEVRASVQEYSWDELSQISALISAAGSDADATEIAIRYHLCNADGTLDGTQTKQIVLADGTSVTMQVLGFNHDERADGTGRAGITFGSCGIVGTHAMNESDTTSGGWRDSSLRSWMNGDLVAQLPDDVAGAIVPVTKLSNNVGVTSDSASVTQTTDALWLFSASEVCGPLDWFVREYGAEPSPYTDYVDFAAYDALLSSEGEQYEYFSAADVTASSDPRGVLELTYGGAGVAWWYRTAYPYSFTGQDASYFYQVMASGYPGTTGLASEPAGVAVGLCL